MRGLMYQTSGQSQGSRRYIEAIPQRVSPRLTVYVIGALGLICGADDGAAEAEASGGASADAIAASVAVWLSLAACAWGAGGAVSSAALGAVWPEPCSNEQPASVTDRARPAAKRARKAKFETILHPRISHAATGGDQLEWAGYNRTPVPGAGRLNVKLCARSRAGSTALSL